MVTRMNPVAGRPPIAPCVKQGHGERIGAPLAVGRTLGLDAGVAANGPSPPSIDEVREAARPRHE